MTRNRLRFLVACLATAAIVLPLAWLWQGSWLPDSYSVMEMGYLDFGDGPPLLEVAGHGSHRGGHGSHGHGREAHAPRDTTSVADLTADPDRPADVSYDLVARKETFRLTTGREIDGYTLNGGSPGPRLEAVEGDLVEVHLTNESVDGGVTLHWHGVDVANAADGVAGVTQDAVQRGGEHTYRFVADQAGTYWYHSHQVSHVQVERGLFGSLVVRPRNPADDVRDVLTISHVYAGRSTLNGSDGDIVETATPGEQVRVRVANTNNGPTEVWASVPFRVVAVDAGDVNGPTEVTDQSVTATAGGRVDLELTVPPAGARVQVGANALLLGPDGTSVPRVAQPARSLDLLSYGEPAPVGFDGWSADRSFVYSIGRRPGFIDGKPGFWWSVNGKLYPDLPMFVVREGEVVRIRIENHSGDVHPMHLHGHHAVVLSRNGERATGSPWWFDSLNVLDGETYEIAFLADNPGLWMDHCHNLKHAAEGLVTHLMYAGVSTPYVVGGHAHNEPE